MLTELFHIITDPPHIAAEVVMEVVSYLTIGRLAIWWHDRKHHVTQDEAPAPAEPARTWAERQVYGQSKVYQTDTGPYEH